METDKESILVAWVPVSLWERVLTGDKNAKYEASFLLNGVVIYDHAFSPPKWWGDVVAVSVENLEKYGVIKSVTLHAEIE